MCTSFDLCLQRNAPVVKIDGHENVPVNDEDALMKAVANQPVSIAMDAGGSDLQFYSEVKIVPLTLSKHSPICMLLSHRVTRPGH